VLGASVLAALASTGVAGCAPERWPWATPPRISPSVGLLRDAIAGEDAMISRYTAVLAAHRGLAGTAAPLLAQHREHLAQLRARLVIPPGANPSQAASATARPELPRPRVPAGQAAAVRYLRTSEQDAAAALVGWVTNASAPPSLAQLLASIGACEAAHAALLGPS
jgi:hypothetical protein